MRLIKQLLTLVVIVATTITTAFAQGTFSTFVAKNRDSKEIYFKAETIIPESISESQKGIIPHKMSERLAEGYVKIIQFKTLPGEELKAEMEAQGIKLLAYVPNRAFLAQIANNTTYETLKSFNVEGINEYHASLKVDKFLSEDYLPNYVVNGNQLRLVAQTYNTLSTADLANQLKSLSDISILDINESMNVVEIAIDKSRVMEVASLSAVAYLEIGHEEGQPENYTARTLHRSNVLNTSYNGGLKYDGTGVVVMMQDDGDIGPHIDFQGRVDQSVANSQTGFGNHGDHVAGTFMGAGNLDPLAEGMAPGVFGFIYGSSNVHYNAVPSRYNNDNLVITTKSYSNGCNAGYTSLTQQLDDQVVDYPSLSHVFSAGNSGTSNCGYGAGSFWGNVTGGHKIGKNVIAVANLNFVDQIAGSSSRGPASDGRIKPDIAAKGSQVYSCDEGYDYRTISGTSMACPGVTGTMAQLYHAYKDLNGGAEPKSGLIKATVLNTAEDLGRPGPDFIYGWGRINGSEAFELLSNNQYMDSSVGALNVNTHTLNIPANVERVKIMLYWTDPASFAGSNFALVNDLDLTVTSPSLNTFQPLVLDPTPVPAILNSAAVPGIDDLNNMEQVVIDNPASGAYTISVNGSQVPQGPQEYFIVYRYETSEVKLTYPIGGESLAPGENQTIRWDAYGNSGSFLLEYSLDSGLTWNLINGNVSASTRTFNWSTPNNVSTSTGMVRISRGGETDQSDAVFTMIGVPSNVQVVSSCSDSAALGWNAVNGADGYIVRMLGAEYMDSVAFTTNTQTYVDGIDGLDPDVWMSVQAVTMSNGSITGYGRRAYAIRKATGIYNCPSEAPVAGFSVDNSDVCVGRTVKFNNETSNGVGSYAWTISPATHTFVNGTNANSEEPEVQFLSDDAYTVTLDAINPGGSSQEVKVDYINPFFPDPFMNEIFLGSSIPLGWDVESSNGPVTWQISQVQVGSNGQSTRAAFFNRFNDVRLNEEDYLITKPVDLTAFTNPILVFDIAMTYQQVVVPSLIGGLRIDVSDDCGFSFSPSVYDKYGDDLRTTGVETTFWSPTSASEWRNDTLDLSPYANSNIQVRFANRSGVLGNSLYIDNVRVIESPVTGLSTGLEADLQVYPNPTVGNVEIAASNIGRGNIQVNVFDVNGELVYNKEVNNASDRYEDSINLRNLPNGIYTIRIAGRQNTVVRKLSLIK